MTEQEARIILGDMINDDPEEVFALEDYEGGSLYWRSYEDHISVDGRYTADQLEAIAWWMRNKHV